MNKHDRAKAVEQFKLEKRGFFGIEDPGPCIALLRDIGLRVDDPLGEVDAVAHPTPPEPEPPHGSAAADGQPVVRRQAAPWVVERNKRRKELGLGPCNKYLPATPHGPKDDDAAAAADSSTSEGSSGDLDESDDDDVWWKQTWYGGTILRDGDPDDSVGRGAPPAGQSGERGKPDRESGGRRGSAAV